ncbi:MAG: ATP-binding cassette domain-containing protein [Nibricoccus sp.]
MNLRFENVRLPLAHFTLGLDLALTARVTAIFGPSGSGKTSLLELIAGLRRPVSGKIHLDTTALVDRDAGQFVPPQQRAIGYVPQDGALFPHLNVHENLLYGFVPQPTRPDGLSFEHVTAVLEISPLLTRPIHTLSGGEKQRVALGRALLAAPRLLLLDEPLASLDAALKERLLPYLLRIRDEFAIPMIYVTHSPDEVVALCDEALIIRSGRIEKRGRPSELFEVTETPRYRLRE